MKKILLTAAALALLGAGCVAVEETAPPVAPEKPAQEQLSETPAVGTGEFEIDIPDDSVLLPADEQWSEVAIRNLGRSYVVEVHPWWHWDATTGVLQADGALFANSEGLLYGGSAQGASYRISLKGMDIANATSLETARADAGITACNTFDGMFEGWRTCIGTNAQGETRGVALQNDGSYEWRASLLASDPADAGVGYFLHLLESFEETK